VNGVAAPPCASLSGCSRRVGVLVGCSCDAALLLGVATLLPGFEPLFPGLAALLVGLAPLFPGLAALLAGLAALWLGLASLWVGYETDLKDGAAGSAKGEWWWSGDNC
jgi:hypothetical protein